MTERLAATNDFSGLSKCSMVRAGYFEDPLVELFFPGTKIGRRTAVINRGYYVRVKMVDTIVRNFLEFTSNTKAQIVSLGAGFDSLFFRLNHLGAIHDGVKFVEVDQLPVVTKKIEIIKANSVLMQMNTMKMSEGDHNCSWTSAERDMQYRLMSCDLNNLEGLQRLLETCELDVAIPTLFLAECVLNYLKPASSNRILFVLANTFTSAAFVSYEQVCPNSGFGLFMFVFIISPNYLYSNNLVSTDVNNNLEIVSFRRQHFLKMGSPLQSITDYPTVDEEALRLKNLGWKVASVPLMSHFYQSALTEADRQRIAQLEPFDEMESWHLKLNHYCVAVAGTSKELAEAVTQFTSNQGGVAGLSFIDNWVLTRLKQLHFQLLPNLMPLKLAESEEIDDKAVLRRFGHSSVLLQSQFLVTIGGIGASGNSGQHGRCKNLTVVELGSPAGNLANARVVMNQQLESGKGERIFASACALGENRIVIFGGRKAPQTLVNSVDIVELDLKEKRVVDISSFQLVGANFPEGRYRHAACMLTADSLIVCGGVSGLGQVLKDVWLLILKTNTWKRMSDLPYPLHSHSIAVHPTAGLIVSGGLKRLEDDSSTLLLIYDIDSHKSQRWRQLELPSLAPRFSHTSHLVGTSSELVLVGGCCLFDFFPVVSVVDIKTAKVQEYRVEFSRPTMVVGHQSAVLPETRNLLVVGGGGNLFSFGTLFSPSFQLSLP